MKKLMLFVLLGAVPAFADNANSFATGFAQGFQRSLDNQQGRQVIVVYEQPPTYQRDQEDYQRQESLRLQQEQVDLQRQQLQEQQNADAWYNR